MTPPDIKSLKEAADCGAASREMYRRADLDRLYALVDALPADGLVVSREVLERVREALRVNIDHGHIPSEGTEAGFMARTALAAIDGVIGGKP